MKAAGLKHIGPSLTALVQVHHCLQSVSAVQLVQGLLIKSLVSITTAAQLPLLLHSSK